MSQKFVLVPYPMYQGLVNPVDNSSFVGATENVMQDILDDKKLNSSEKHALYYNQLHNLLKHKKEVENRPVKVQITNPLDQNKTIVVTKPGSDIGHVLGSDDQVEIKDTSQSLMSKSEESNSTSPKLDGTPKPKHWDLRKSPPKTGVIGNRIFEEASNALYAHVTKNPMRFNIDDYGQILDGRGQPVQDSDVRAVVERIVKTNLMMSAGEKSPKGTSLLQGRVDKDTNSKKILTEAYKKLVQQRGYGLPKNNTSSLFKPDRWSKNV